MKSFVKFTDNFCKIMVFIYLAVMAVVFPFYLTNGYRSAGTDKSMFFRYAGIALLITVLPGAIICLISCLKRDGGQKRMQQFPVSDGFLLGYLGVTLVSFFCSENRTEAFWGTSGWYIGLATQGIYVASYFFVSRFLAGGKWILLLFAVSSSATFFLGILNRFSVYPLELDGATSYFIATLGNINWFCGYWSIFFAAAAGFFYKSKKKAVWKRLLFMLYLALCAATGAVQGSDSALLVFAGVMLTLFVLSAQDLASRQSFYETLLVICVACQCMRIICIRFPQAMNYESTIATLMVNGNLTLIMGIAAVLLWLLAGGLRKRQAELSTFLQTERWIILGLLGFLLVLYVVLLVKNTNEPGSIGSLSGIGAFTFQAGWGSYRGVTWTAGLKVFSEQSLLHQLVGIGPDSFAYGVYRDGSGAAAMVREVFGKSRLTNAHNEWITVLVNTGCLGLITYAGFFLTKAVRFLKPGEAESRDRQVAFALGLALIGYMSNNIFSFQQVLNGPFIFIALGMAEAYFRKCRQEVFS